MRGTIYTKEEQKQRVTIEGQRASQWANKLLKAQAWAEIAQDYCSNPRQADPTPSFPRRDSEWLLRISKRISSTSTPSKHRSRATVYRSIPNQCVCQWKSQVSSMTHTNCPGGKSQPQLMQVSTFPIPSREAPERKLWACSPLTPREQLWPSTKGNTKWKGGMNSWGEIRGWRTTLRDRQS